jgi:hypothetical protein
VTKKNDIRRILERADGGSVTPLIPRGSRGLLSTPAAGRPHSAVPRPAMRIFVLSGQSNMAGRGGVHHKHWDGVVPPECAPDPSILRLSSAQQWEEAREPLHADIDTTKTCGIGPGMAFARAVLSSLQEDTPGAAAQIGLVPCAVGGTAIREWSLGKHLYEQMVSRARVATLYGEIEAILWYQGESDAESDADTSAYLENVERLICNVRADLGMPQLPFIQVMVLFLLLTSLVWCFLILARFLSWI